jgi:ribonuclease HI
MINVYVDGSFSPVTGEGSYGMIIQREGKTIKIGGPLGQIKDNNVAEYGAMVRGFQELKKMGLHNEIIKIHTDSQVIYRQLLKHIPPPVQKEHSKWYSHAASLFKSFSRCVIDFIYSSCNPAHDVAKQALNSK